MVRIFPVNEFAQRKKILLLESELHRQTLRGQIAAAQDSLAHFQKRFAILGISSVALSVGASVAGLLLAKKQAGGGGKSGLFSKVLSGFSVFSQVKSIFSRFRHSPDNSE